MMNLNIENLQEERINDWVSFSLKIGTMISLIFISVGLTLLIIDNPNKIVPVLSPNQLLQESLNLNPTAIITLGIISLLITPVIQIITATIVFCINKDKLFGGISITILCILIFSLVLALT